MKPSRREPRAKQRGRKHVAHSRGEIAEFFQVAIGTVDKWREQGMPGTATHWDLSDIYQWLRAREDAVRKRENKEELSRRVEKLKMLLLKDKLLVSRGQLVARQDFNRFVRRICSSFRNGLLGLGASLAGQLRGLDTPRQHQLIRERFAELLQDLSENAGSQG